MEPQEELRQLEKNWDLWIIAAALIVSFLGTFTSTQLMIQARLSTHLSGVISWIIIISLTFGFCAAWSLHFISMLACRLDLPIGLDFGLTLFSALLAVTFTFAALGTDLLRERYNKNVHPARHFRNDDEPIHVEANNATTNEDWRPLLGPNSTDESPGVQWVDEDLLVQSGPKITTPQQAVPRQETSYTRDQNAGLEIAENEEEPAAQESQLFSTQADEYVNESRNSTSQRSSNLDSPFDIRGMAFQGNYSTKNAFVATYEVIYAGISWKAVGMGLIWSLSITGMHYGGIASMRIPGGFLTLNPILVIISALISWIVFILGYIYMLQVESHLNQQVLFSAAFAAGIAAMHFTGMRATTFWSHNQPAEVRGYPPQLPVAVCSIAILTCMLANGLLAHSATVSRNKLAEIVWTRRKLWRTMAQKENAEAAAAARSNFIALASHEIRTPLHHLQGYSDLLSRTELKDDSRRLLLSIQRATKTLSLITNNVLDWSKLESNRDVACRPVSLDMRSVFESILVLLPNKDDEAEVEMLVIIAPDVPKYLLLDETYVHRILMNLLSNSLKFTRFGYVMLTLEIDDAHLVARVSDTGTGIPPSFVPRLFEPFSQANTRGSQQGTGLGLSIVQQLLRKMDGTVSVESKHDEQGYGPSETGTTFTVTIPVRASLPTSPHKQRKRRTVAIFHPDKPRTLEGLKIAWEISGYNVTVVKRFSELSDLQLEYVWVEPNFLHKNPECLQQLVDQKKWTVLVPSDSQALLHRLPGLLSSPGFVPLEKPLVWHTFEARKRERQYAALGSNNSETMRSDSKFQLDVGLHQNSSNGSTTLKNITILLVEDNQINQRLGQKMLATLGYTVLLASDGDEAITKTLQHDTQIDVILMDQSMPIKDGVTATREIRALESSGKLARQHPIIAVTAVVDLDSQAHFRDAGANEFLAKPLSLEKLGQTLVRILSGKLGDRVGV